MGEEKIIIEINPDGSIKAKSEGFQGDLCIDAIQKLLGNEMFTEIKPTDDFNNDAEVNSASKIRRL